MAGFFGKLFDLNGDGKLNTFETAMDFAAFTNIIEPMDTEETMDELELAGLNRLDLEFMGERERQEAIEDAGLDPDDFDFD
ncbi:MAG: hypothetical protein PHU31_04650 [Anaerotignum sp.]|nr:hypothetical protein [Anaerotignum sp.]